MPRAAKQKPPDPESIYVSWTSWTSAALGSRVITQGQRLRGDDQAVQAAPHLFVRDGTPADEIQRLAAADIEAVLEDVRQPPPPPPPEPLRDEDSLVAIRDADGQAASNVGLRLGLGSPVISAAGFVHAGERVPKDHPAVKRDRAAFVPVTDGSIPRDQAVVAQTTFRHLQEDGELRTVYAGQWLHRDDPLAAVHPHQVRPPEPEPR